VKGRPRNAFGFPFSRRDYVEYGAAPDETCYLCLLCVAVGDQNAVDIVQALRMDAHVGHGVCDDEDFVHYGHQVPSVGRAVGGVRR
jgi:hypothetical protein